jgi:hypothetical protein
MLKFIFKGISESLQDKGEIVNENANILYERPPRLSHAGLSLLRTIFAEIKIPTFCRVYL